MLDEISASKEYSQKDNGICQIVDEPVTFALLTIVQVRQKTAHGSCDIEGRNNRAEHSSTGGGKAPEV